MSLGTLQGTTGENGVQGTHGLAQMVSHSAISGPVTTSGLQLTRKCMGKNKQVDCLQGCEHGNTRWECSFDSQVKEDFRLHCKNISKRNRWRDLVNVAKPDKDGLYRCVYYSTDKHHVENHYSKGSAEQIPPSSQSLLKGYLMPGRGSLQNALARTRGSKRPWININTKLEDDEYADDPEREIKKLRTQELNYVPFMNLAAAAEGEDKGPEDKEYAEKVVLPDNLKIEEFLDTIEKKLEIPHDHNSLDRLHKQGFMIVYGLKNLKKEGWEKLGLPPAIEEEMKNLINGSKAIHQWYNFWNPPMYSEEVSQEPLEEDAQEKEGSEEKKEDSGKLDDSTTSIGIPLVPSGVSEEELE